MKHDSFNESAEMYLKTVSELAIGEGPVPISALAGRLGVSPVSATEMVHRLQDHGLIDHRPYKGILLTESGHQQASGIIRSHRLWECFLHDELGMPWEQVHGFACRLEHASDRHVIDALDEYLHYPPFCPHGNPIPKPDGSMEEAVDLPLAAMHTGETAIITRIHPETDELLAYLSDLKLTTGTRVTLTGKIPFGGPMVLATGSSDCYLGQEASERVFVQLREGWE